jgi:hypothetical protein
MLKENTLNEYETSYRLGHSFRQKVIQYIERCHLEDGGYFFARVTPSSGLDTYFAIKSLSILGIKPNHLETVKSFILQDLEDDTLAGITGLFITTEVLSELASLTDEIKKFVRNRVITFQTREGDFSVSENIDVEVTSELESAYRIIKTLKSVDADLNAEKIRQFVFNLLNSDGGYGRDNHSTLATTYYASEIHKIISTDTGRLDKTINYLRQRETQWMANFENRRVSFLEDLFWMVNGLNSLNCNVKFPDSIVKYILECQRFNGGFARAAIMGIPTLEYTYYALLILRDIGVL